MELRADNCALLARSRNLLDYEHTGLALTRIYAVEHLQVDPPSPPGYMVKDSVKHFHIIKDPAPPPPPNPPPSPPLYPPPPLPSFLGTRMETHIECTFEENMDFSITSTTAGSYSDRKAETQKHCCSLCGMEPGCTNFVYEPASKTCVLLPHVPSTELVKTPNPSTVAGSVSISHISNYHADCEFEVGSGYSGGSLGMGAPLSGMKIATKQACCSPPVHFLSPPPNEPLPAVQDCCDACEREAKCVKFSFEIFSGTCEMFVSFSEHYFTSGLASGIVNGRAAQVTHAGVGENAEAIVGLIVPPAPPSFVLQLAASSPPPAGDDIGLRVVADMSLSAGFIMISGFFICLYCFFSPQLLSLLYKVSNGKLGKPSRSLVAGQHSGGVQGKASKKHRRKQQLEPGWAVVTVQTSQLSQNKEVEVEGCETLDELRDVIWEEFGHLLNGIKRPKKDTVILCLTGSDEASGQGWQLVTAASDLARVVDCGALKLMEKILIDVDTLSIAFSRSLPAPKRGTRGAPALLTHRDRNANDDTDDDDTDDDEAPGARRGKGRSGKGEFEPLVADSSSDEGEGTCRAGSDNKANAREKARGQARSARKPKGADAMHDASRGRETQGSKRPTKDAPSSQQGSNLQMDAAPPVLTGDYFDNAPERSNTLPQTRPVAMESDATTAFIGKRVRIHGLASMGELNGQIGLAKSYDQTKQRYRVQFIGPNGTTKVLGFKPVNLQPI